MFRIIRFMSLALIASLSIVGISDNVPWPSPETEINDVDPRVPLGAYIIHEASNTTSRLVVLTNGVLTVNGETINVAEPIHTVVTTNVVDGRIIITTNTYDAVYQDGLSKTLESYATIKKLVLTPNEDGTVTTNYVDVAYVNDIPPDDKKADKVINLWEYYCPQIGAILERSDSKIAPFSAWEWNGNTNGIFHVGLIHTGGVWTCSINGTNLIKTVIGEDTDREIDFADYSFSSTNENGVAYVVYTDALRKARNEFIENELSLYVAKTNFYEVADRIQEDQLTTINGIVNTLLGIRQELLSISGEKGLTLSFTNVTAGLTLTLNNADISGVLGKVDVDWGDGEVAITNFPCSHTYNSSHSGVVEVVVSGTLKSISGYVDGEAIVPFASWDDSNNGRLFAVTIDRPVGLEELGDYAFANTSVSSLDFARSANISRLGKYCFFESGITSLYGMPDVQVVPDYCFSRCRLVSLNGLGDNVSRIGDGAFSECTSLRSISGIGTTAGPVYIGKGAFEGCTALVSLFGLDQTSIDSVAERCFRGCSALASIAYLPPTVSEIGEYAFDGTQIKSLNGIPSSVKSVREGAFSSCDSLTDARALWNTSLKSVGANAFSNSPLQHITFPETLSYLSASSLSGINYQDEEGEPYRATIKFLGKRLDEAKAIPVSQTETNVFGFAWGLRTDATNDTLIIGIDGEMYYNPSSEEWVTNRTVLTFSLLLIPENTTVMLGTVEETPVRRDYVFDGNSIMIDWGDGTRNYERSHSYPESIAPTITVYGKAERISGIAANHPFVKIDGKETNNYLYSASLGDCFTFKALGAYSFVGCTALSSVIGLGEAFESVGEGCFEGAKALSDIEFLSLTKITLVPRFCFMGCTGISSLQGLPDSVSEIGDSSFMGCSSISSIDDLPSLVSSIPDDAFRGCVALTNVDFFGRHIGSIGSRSFADCIKIDEVRLDRETEVGSFAFERVGTDASTKTDEDGLTFKVSYVFPNGDYVSAAETLGLDTDSGIPYCGLDREVSKIVCANEEQIVWHQEGTVRRWEILLPALEIELKGVTSNTAFQVARTFVESQASVIWNWGDGTSMWVSQSPGPHTYTNSEPRNFTIRVKGLLSGISAEGGAAGGAYVRPVGEIENPFLVGFKLPDNTPLKSVGSYSFSRCPNLKNINTINLPRRRSLAPPKRRGEPITRLQQLFKSRTNLPIEFGEFCFYGSGIEDLSGLPEETTILPKGLFQMNESLKSLSTLRGSNITDIGENCFDNTGITNLVGYPANIGYVSTYSFANCNGLYSLYGLPQNIIDMGYGAFYNCWGLSSLDGYSTNMTYVSDYSFANCKNLASIESLSNINITAIGEGSFSGCTNLLSLYGFPNTVKTIGLGGFRQSGLITLENMSSNLESISEITFAQCPNLITTAGLPTNICELPRMAFLGCTNMVEADFDGYAITNIGEFCLADNSKLTNVVIGSRVSEIGISALLGCGTKVLPVPDEDRNMISCSIRFPNLSCAEIRKLWNTNFVTTPPTTKLIGWNGYLIDDGENGWIERNNTIHFKIRTKTDNCSVFAGTMTCLNDTEYEIRWGDPETLAPDEVGSALTNHVYKNIGIYDIYIIGRVERIDSFNQSVPFFYSRESDLDILECNVGNNAGLSFLGESVFRGIGSITNIFSLSDSDIYEIGSYCFADCRNLKSLDGIPLRLCSLSTNAFSGCTSLTDISNLSNTTVIAIAPGAFSNCTDLSTLVGFPESVTNVSDFCFFGDPSLKSLNGLSDNLFSVGAFSFSRCTRLKDLYGLSSNLVVLGEGTFKGCSAITNISMISRKVSTFPSQCFEGCSALTSLKGIPHLLEIGSGCFRDCTSLLDGHGFNTEQGFVNESMFEGCTSLTNINFLAENIGALSNQCFKGCTGLLSIDIREPITNIMEQAFADCSRMSNVVVHIESPNIASDAFSMVGSGGDWISDEFGNSIKTVITFTELFIDEIRELSGFPFSAPPKTTIFRGKDGSLIWDGTEWQTIRVVIEVGIKANANEELRLGDIIAFESNTLCSVSWGDGSGITYSGTTNLTHSYKTASTYLIRIAGNIKEISATNQTAFVAQIIGGIESPSNTVVKSFRISPDSNVERIGEKSFRNCSALESISIESMSVGEIGESSFAGCIGLKTIGLDGSSVTNIGKRAFSGAYITDTLDWLPDVIQKIGDNCFENCISIKEFGDKFYELPLSKIGDSAFKGCSSLGKDGREIMWPSNIVRISSHMFDSCGSISYLYLQEGCESVHTNAFLNMGANASPKPDETGRNYRTCIYILYKTMAQVQEPAFSGLDIPASLFPFGATHETKFICKDGYLSYENWAWREHKYDLTISITNVTAGTTVTIGNTILANNTVSSWNFGDGFVTNNVSSFPISHTYDRSINRIQVSCNGKIEKISGNSQTSPWIRLTNNGGVDSVVINESSGLKDIGNYSFSGISTLRAVEIYPREVTNFGYMAFLDCASLRNVRMPRNFSPHRYKIGAYAFSNCASLEEIVLAEKVAGLKRYMASEIAANAFSQCKNMRRITVDLDFPINSTAFSNIGLDAPKSMTNRFGFAYGTEIAPINKIEAQGVLGKSSTIWGASHNAIVPSDDGFVGYENGWKPFEHAVVFILGEQKNYRFLSDKTLMPGEGDYKALEVVIGNSVVFDKIGDYAFRGFNSLSNIIVHSSAETNVVKTMGKQAFMDCRSLSSLPTEWTHWTKNISRIEEDTFRGCGSLSGMSFPNCRYFGDRSFAWSGIDSIQWMTNNAIVGSGCFNNCKSLKSGIGYPSNGDRTIREKCFNESGITSLEWVPETITNIENQAFGGLDGFAPYETIKVRLEALSNQWLSFPSVVSEKKGEYLTVDTLDTCLKEFGLGAFDHVKRIFTNTEIKDSPFVDGKSYGKPSEVITNDFVIYSDGWINGGNPFVSNKTYWPSLEVHDSRTDADVFVVMTNLPSSALNGVSLNVGIDNSFIGRWGDSMIETNKPFTHSYSITPEKEYLYLNLVKGVSALKSSSAQYPFFRTSTTGNPYVKFISIRSVPVIQQYSLAGLPNCSEVFFRHDMMPEIGSNALNGLGTGLSMSTEHGFSHKAEVNFENLEIQTLIENGLPWGAPTDTLFLGLDGFVVYTNSAWTKFETGMKINIEWAGATYSVDCFITTNSQTMKVTENPETQTITAPYVSGRYEEVLAKQNELLEQGYLITASATMPGKYGDVEVVSMEGSPYEEGAYRWTDYYTFYFSPNAYAILPYLVRQIQKFTFDSTEMYTGDVSARVGEIWLTYGQFLHPAMYFTNTVYNKKFYREETIYQYNRIRLITDNKSRWEKTSCGFRTTVLETTNITTRTTTRKIRSDVAFGLLYAHGSPSWTSDEIDERGGAKFYTHNVMSLYFGTNYFATSGDRDQHPYKIDELANVTFKDNKYGYYQIDGGPKIKLGSNTTIKENLSPFGDHTINIYGRIKGINKWCSQPDGDYERRITFGYETVKRERFFRVKSVEFPPYSEVEYVERAPNLSVYDINWPNTITNFGIAAFSVREAFYDRHSYEAKECYITNLTWLPTSLKSISPYCFYGQLDLSYLHGIGETAIDRIESKAFGGCAGLRGSLEVQKTPKAGRTGVFPDTLTYVAGDAFSNVGGGGDADSNELALCFKRKTTDDIMAMPGFSFTDPVWYVNPIFPKTTEEPKNRVKWYGTDGKVEEYNKGNHTRAFIKTQMATGL